MKKVKIPGSTYFKQIYKKEKDNFKAVELTVKHIDAYYERDEITQSDLFNILKLIRIYEFFNKKIISSLTVGFLSGISIFYLEQLVGVFDKINELLEPIKDIPLAYIIASIIAILICFFPFFILFSTMIKDTIKMNNDTYCMFLLSYEKKIIENKLKANEEIRKILK